MGPAAARYLLRPAHLRQRGTGPALSRRTGGDSRPHSFRHLPDREAVQHRLAKSVSKLAQEAFGFLHWVAADPGTQPPDHVLTLVLDEQEAIPAPKILLRFHAKRGGENKPLPAELNRIIYRPTQLDRPTHAAEQLGQVLDEHLGEHFRSQGFKQGLHRQFLTTIPLARTIRVPIDENRVIVPVRWDEMRPSMDSIFLVRFKAASEGGARYGNMKLSSSRKRAGDPASGATECRIAWFDFGEINLTGPNQWHPEIPRIFTGDIPVRVFMLEYVRDLFGWSEDGSFDSF